MWHLCSSSSLMHQIRSKFLSKPTSHFLSLQIFLIFSIKFEWVKNEILHKNFETFISHKASFWNDNSPLDNVKDVMRWALFAIMTRT